MTIPTVIVPTKAKMWWAMAGGVLSTLVTIIPWVAGVLPPPWGPALTGIVAVINAFMVRRVHQTPNLPPGAVIAPPGAVVVPPSSDEDPWK